MNVSFTLKNTGKRAGDEVVQVYVKLPEVAGGTQAIKQLKGFHRVALKAGESWKVEITVDKEQLRYWDEKQTCFVVPQGSFTFMVGASSNDIRLENTTNL